MSDALELATILAEDDPEAAADFLATLPMPVAITFLAGLPTDILAPVLGHVPETMAKTLLTSMKLENAAEAVGGMTYPFKTQVARSLPTPLLRDILDLLPRRDARQIRRDLTYALGSVGAWMETAPTVLDEGLTVGEVLTTLRKRRRTPDSTLVLTHANTVYAGVINASRLLGATERQPIRRYLDRTVKPLAPESLITELAQSVEWNRHLSLPVVGRNGALLGILRRERLELALETETETDLPADMGGTIGILLEAALICADGFTAMFSTSGQRALSTNDPEKSS